MRTLINITDTEREKWADPWRKFQDNGQPIAVAYGGGVDSSNGRRRQQDGVR